MSYLLDYFNSQITSQTSLAFLSKEEMTQIFQMWVERKSNFIFLEQIRKKQVYWFSSPWKSCSDSHQKGQDVFSLLVRILGSLWAYD